MIHSNNEAGRSMIEMLGVLAIIGVLSVGGIAGYSKAMMQYKINKTADQITQIVGNMRTLFASQKGYNGLTWCWVGTCSDTLLKKAHVIPDEMWSGSSGNKIENAFGGEVQIGPANKRNGESGNKAFTIGLYGLPEEACMALATYDWGSGSSSGLVAVSVNIGTPTGYEATNVGCTGKSSMTGSSRSGSPRTGAVACPNGPSVAVPMPVNIAATACTEGEDNDVSFIFY